MGDRLRRSSADEAQPARASVVVAAEHRLVADSVRSALRGRGVEVQTVSWSDPGGVLPPAGAERGLLISDLDSEPAIVRAHSILTGIRLEWVVLTGARRGPIWGAVLEAGARTVLSSSTPLDEVCLALRTPWSGSEELSFAGRDELLAQWEVLWRDRADKSARLAHLSPREMQVLRLLYRGEPVVQIARSLGIRPATVRSQVKSLLRKLDVNSQLAAVAVYGYASGRRRIESAQQHPDLMSGPLDRPRNEQDLSRHPVAELALVGSMRSQTVLAAAPVEIAGLQSGLGGHS